MEKQSTDSNSIEDKLAKLRAKEQECLRKYGWYAHMVMGGGPKQVNYHTHGIFERYGTYDLQIVLPLDPKLGHQILATVAGRVKSGTQLYEGQALDDIIGGGYKVKISQFIEGDRPVWRIILPDESGNLEQFEPGSEYAAQYHQSY